MTYDEPISDEEASAFLALVKRRVQSATATGPANRDDVEAAVEAIYRLNNLPPPRIEWFLNPLDAATAACTAHAAGDALDHHALTRGMGITQPGFRPDLLQTLAHASVELLRLTATSATPAMWVAGSVLPARPRQGYVANLLDCMREALTLPIPTKHGSRPVWTCIIHAPHTLLSYIHTELMYAMIGKPVEQLPLRHFLTLLTEAGHILMCQNVCYISERPVQIAEGENGDLHSEDGPAIQYADGYGYHYWNGIRVPQSVAIIPPAAITKDYIRAHPTFTERSVLIARMGLSNFIAEAATLVHEDESGRLYKVKIGRGKGYNWAVVEVVNGTPEPVTGVYKTYYLQVPPIIRRAREAVAWTYGLPEAAYNVAVRT